ncbi:hypothetical protein [Bosea vestrisii]|uniref:Uncharacterized protein n=1 Tax=Bosea vestrisii TaxID=151416 RepID=A0ABW0H786_9HYPH
MASHPNAELFSALTNQLTMSTAVHLSREVNRIAREHGHDVAVTIGVDAALSAAVAMLRSALLNGSVALAAPHDQVMRRRLERILILPQRVHERRPDGSFDPDGQVVS